MPRGSTSRWAEVPKGPKRGGWTTNSKTTETMSSGWTMDSSDAKTTTDGWTVPSASTITATGAGTTTPASTEKAVFSWANVASALARAGKQEKSGVAVTWDFADDKASATGECSNSNKDWCDDLPPSPPPFHPMGWCADPSNPDRQIPFFLKEKCLVCCVDLENHCYNQTWEDHQKGIRSRIHRTCEIGMAFADGRKLLWDDRGDRWCHAWPSINASAEDYAIREHEHKAPYNKAYDCRRGRPGHFLYGKPTWINLADTKSVVVNKIKSMLGDEKTADVNSDKPYWNDTRLIFVYFASRGDIRWLHNLGIDLPKEFPNNSTVDLQRGTIGRLVSKRLSKSQCSADDYITTLGLETTEAHNGGNDAVHELRAFLAEFALSEEQRDLVFAGITCHCSLRKLRIHRPKRPPTAVVLVKVRNLPVKRATPTNTWRRPEFANPIVSLTGNYDR